jgi:hypothetical protein
MDVLSSQSLVVSGGEVADIKSACDFFSALTAVIRWPVYLCYAGTSISSDVMT